MSMKIFKSREKEKDCRICGAYNGANLGIARLLISEVRDRESMHSHEAGCEYYIFLKGKAEMIVNGKKSVFGAGDVVLVEPGEKHRISKIIGKTDYITIKTNTDPKDKRIYE